VAVGVEVLGTLEPWCVTVGQVAAAGELGIEGAVLIEDGPGPEPAQIVAKRDGLLQKNDAVTW